MSNAVLFYIASNVKIENYRQNQIIPPMLNKESFEDFDLLVVAQGMIIVNLVEFCGKLKGYHSNQD